MDASQCANSGKVTQYSSLSSRRYFDAEERRLPEMISSRYLPAMVEWGMSLRRRGCWFSWQNVEELVKILEEEVPHGQLAISREEASETTDQNGVRWRTTSTGKWADLDAFKTDMQGTQVIAGVVIERHSPVAEDPRIIIEIGKTTRTWRPFGRQPFAKARLSGGSKSWQSGAANRIATTFAEARFLGRRLTKWLDRLELLCVIVAFWSLVYSPSGVGGLVGSSAFMMGIAAYQVDKYLTRTTLLNGAKGLQGFVARRSANHRVTGGSQREVMLFVTSVLGGIAGVIGTIVAIIAYVFPRG
ncbi:hypothetical protein [Streptomyces avermitilis]|uniref:hypothetical protein n=1 Tax=Streptomyces avermitilis TaxID=33903 RepID=UPI0005651B9E|nr:hypothetical protein [Streptomyces avermitilis]